MDRRRIVDRQQSAYNINSKDIEDDGEQSDYEDSSKKGKFTIPTSTWAGIWMSAALLLTFIVFLGTRLDIIHIALSHESTFHANHIPENHLDMVLNRPSPSLIPEKASDTKTMPTLITSSSKLTLRAETHGTQQPVKIIQKTDGDLDIKLQKQIKLVQKMKFEDHIVMEQDETAKREIAVLQNILREYVPQKYGPEPYRIEMTLIFPASMHDNDRSDEEKIIFELAPLEFVPYSTYKFLEIMETFKGGAFHRRAGHVLQAMVNTEAKHLAFQEYHPAYPHIKHTLGYAGRPGGPAFYISTVDNTGNHGPASQGSKTEADSCFGKIVEGLDIVKRMQKQPGGEKGSGFIGDSKNFIRIKSLKIVK